VRLVQLINGPTLTVLPLLDPAKDFGTVVSSGYPWGFYFDGGGINCLPSGTNATLRIRYYARPGLLVIVSGATAVRITVVTPGVTTTTFQTASPLASANYDLISSGPAHQQVAIDAVVTSLGGVTMSVPTASLLEQPQVGDYISLPDTSPYVCLPEELSDVVVLNTAARYLRARGYLEEAQTAQSQAEKALAPAIDLLRPRSDGNLKRLSGGVVSQLQQGMRRGFGWGGWW
jgi:hypothetical protein